MDATVALAIVTGTTGVLSAGIGALAGSWGSVQAAEVASKTAASGNQAETDRVNLQIREAHRNHRQGVYTDAMRAYRAMRASGTRENHQGLRQSLDAVRLVGNEDVRHAAEEFMETLEAVWDNQAPIEDADSAEHDLVTAMRRDTLDPSEAGRVG